MSRQISRCPDKQITRAASLAQLRMLLASCSDPALERMTAEGLAATHRVGVKEAEYELVIARQRRAA